MKFDIAHSLFLGRVHNRLSGELRIYFHRSQPEYIIQVLVDVIKRELTLNQSFSITLRVRKNMSISLQAQLQKEGLESVMLDDLVVQAANSEASRINNEGMAAQLDYLVKAGISDNRILEELGIKR